MWKSILYSFIFSDKSELNIILLYFIYELYFDDVSNNTARVAQKFHTMHKSI
jgi:hypothetical protein